MPDEEKRPLQPGERKPLVQILLKNALIGTLNLLSKLPGITSLQGMGKRTYETRTVGGYQEEEMRKELKSLFELNFTKISNLKNIEAEWDPLLENIIFKGTKENPDLVEVYKEIGIYTDIKIAQTEAECFEHGTWEVEKYTLEKSDEKPKLIRVQIKPVTLGWDKFGSSFSYNENLIAFGHVGINKLKAPLSTLRPKIQKIGTSNQPHVDTRTFSLNLIDELVKTLENVRQIEEKHYNYLNDIIIPKTRLLKGIRVNVGIHKPPLNIRFSHTYYIIKSVVLVKVGSKIDPETGKVLKVKRIEKVRELVDGKEVDVDKQVEEEMPITTPIYFNPHKNPRTDELEEVITKINSINEAEVNKRIGQLERFLDIMGKKLNEFLKNTNGKLEELIKYLNIKILGSSDGYKKVMSKLTSEQQNNFFAEINKFVTNNILILSDMGDSNIKQLKDASINQIKHLFELLKPTFELYEIKEEKIKNFFDILQSESSRLENLKRNDFIKQKRQTSEHLLNLLKDIKVNIDIYPEFVDLINKLLVYSTKDIGISIDRLISEFIDKIIEILKTLQKTEQLPKNKEDGILELAGLLQKNIKNYIKLVRNETNRIEKMRRELEIDELREDIVKLEQQITNLKNQIELLKELKKGKVVLEKEIKDFVPNHPNFEKLDDEVDWGLDENGYALEVDPKTGEVLLDRWWKELSEHPTRWHEKIIKNKQGGEKVWKAKVENGVKKYGIRRINKDFIEELDTLDMGMFAYNEWDAYRDDFRDGRYHPHSKTLMDYLIAANNGVIPKKLIKIHFDPIKDYKTFEPIKKDVLPADEQQITQDYEMRIFDTSANQFVHKPGSRIPTHLNPAFDRAALTNENVLHWGRMYYYETTDGITRWSENPFPHVTTRGLAHYLIDRVIRGSYKFEDARNALKGWEWDYGRRHYTPHTGPYITDPLGEGGVNPTIHQG
ncbi:hypothetical protein J4480_04725 [Candidatus Woesearchaeota archaeon]|nr:hypothetical protein [Candidatus Woesearchaeota archaeon]